MVGIKIEGPVSVTSRYYNAEVHCALLEGPCDFRASGVDARMQAINHTKETGHTVIVRVESTEEIKAK